MLRATESEESADRYSRGKPPEIGGRERAQAALFDDFEQFVQFAPTRFALFAKLTAL